MDIFNLAHTCSEMNLPVCKTLDRIGCKNTCRTADLGPFRIQSPSTIAFLLVAVLCATHFLRATNRHYAAIGRKEFALLFQFYISCLILDIILISGIPIPPSVTVQLVAVQLASASTAVITLFVGGWTPVTLPDFGFFKSITVVKIVSAIYFVISLSVIYFSIATKNGLILFLHTCILNLIFLFCYVISQLILLAQADAEVWAYGTLSIATTFFLIGTVFLFYGSTPATLISERYLDGLFFFHLMMFCSVIMVHKYWLSICDFEAECTPLIKEDD